MDLDTFTTETLDYFWRENDTKLASTMPKLIRTAENRLRIDLKVTDTDIGEAWSIEDPTNYLMPDNLDVLKSVQWDTRGAGQYVSLDLFNQPVNVTNVYDAGYSARSKARESGNTDLEYTIVGRTLLHRFGGASPTAPQIANVTYTALPASLNDDDDSLYNLYTAAYEAAVYYEVAKWLREEERANLFDKEYASRVDTARFEQSNRKYAGSPLKMSMPRGDIS